MHSTFPIPLGGHTAFTPPLPRQHGVTHAASSSSFANVCELLRICDLPDCEQEPHRFRHALLHSGQSLHLIGQQCDQLFVVKTGFLKTTQMGEPGKQQVFSFPMRGDMLGIDGIASGRHTLEAVALSDCELVLIPLDDLTLLGRRHPGLQLAMCSVMGRNLARAPVLIGARAGLGTRARVARFLTYQAERHAACGFSGNTFTLRMQREDIANYLCMATETVIRTLGMLEGEGLIAVNRRLIRIHDAAALRNLQRDRR